MEQLIPLETATQHFAAAVQRGEAEGQRKERERVYAFLKKTGQYQLLVALRKNESEDNSK